GLRDAAGRDRVRAVRADRRGGVDGAGRLQADLGTGGTAAAHRDADRDGLLDHLHDVVHGVVDDVHHLVDHVVDDIGDTVHDAAPAAASGAGTGGDGARVGSPRTRRRGIGGVGGRGDRVVLGDGRR